MKDPAGTSSWLQRQMLGWYQIGVAKRLPGRTQDELYHARQRALARGDHSMTELKVIDPSKQREDLAASTTLGRLADHWSLRPGSTGPHRGRLPGS